MNKIEIKSQIFRKGTFVDLSENITGFYGRSGCGKTMLIKEIANHLNVKINNYSIGEEKSITQNDLDIINDYIWYLDYEIRSVSFNNSGSLDVLHKTKNEFILPFEQEGSGTQKAILMLPTLVKSLQDGTIFIIDEIERHLHPEVVKFIIRLFSDAEYNKKNAKLIFTSHSVNIFDYLNKENIVIIRRHDGGSFLIALKNDTEYCKDTIRNDFLKGIYGSHPNIKAEHVKSKLDPEDFLDN